MQKSDLKEITIYKNFRGFYVSKTGRIFKELNYSGRGNRDIKYKCVSFKSERLDVHRVVADQFLTNEDKNPWVLHIDDNPLNNNVENLKWGTPKENAADAIKNGCFKKYALRRGHKKEQTHNLILGMVKDGIKTIDIASSLGASQYSISSVIKKLRESGRLIIKKKTSA